MASQFPLVGSPQRLSVAAPVAGGTNKVALKPGYSLMDWIRLTKSGADLRGTGPRLLRIGMEELKKHNTSDDAWLAIRGYVYNVTKYIDYHPGGAEELLRGAGKDATELFDEIHRWVNYESMLKACLVGRLEQEVTSTKKVAPVRTPAMANTLGVSKLSLPAPPQKPSSSSVLNETAQFIIPAPVNTSRVTSDWSQTSDEVSITYQPNFDVIISRQDVVCDVNNNGRSLKAGIFLNEKVIILQIDLAEQVQPSIRVDILENGKIVAFKLLKFIKGKHWEKLRSSSGHNSIVSRKSMEIEYRESTLISKSVVTHDTSIYHLRLPESCHMVVPVCNHVYLQVKVDDMLISRPYTLVLPDLTNQNSESEIDSQNLYLMIKTYTDGAFSSCLKNINVGDKVLVSTYEGKFSIKQLLPYKHVVLLCAGTGFTPMIRILHYCLHNTDKQVKLFFYNKKQKDILWENQLDKLSRVHASRFYVEHVLSKPADDWKGKRGRINLEQMKEIVTETLDPTVYYVCGPKPFTELCLKLLNDLSVQKINIFAFTA